MGGSLPYFKPYKYVKDESYDPFYTSVSSSFVVRSRAYPVAFLALGVFVLLTQIVIPLISFKTMDKIAKPVESSVLGIASGFGDFEFEELDENVGVTTYKSLPNMVRDNVPQFFYLSIPKLGIDRALVETNAPTLKPDEALGHYKGSTLPGEVGNAFIYGHSVLPIFYNPKNYKTIFSTLGRLAEGDMFTIEYNNKKMTYIVDERLVLKPEQVNPIADVKPKYLNESTVTLMTCDPPGTKINRLLINATLVR